MHTHTHTHTHTHVHTLLSSYLWREKNNLWSSHPSPALDWFYVALHKESRIMRSQHALFMDRMKARHPRRTETTFQINRSPSSSQTKLRPAKRTHPPVFCLWSEDDHLEQWQDQRWKKKHNANVPYFTRLICRSGWKAGGPRPARNAQIWQGYSFIGSTLIARVSSLSMCLTLKFTPGLTTTL